MLKNIFIGHYGTGKTLLASQILKIKSAQFKKNNKNVKKYVFEYNELIGQLQLDPEQKWLYEYSELYNGKLNKMKYDLEQKWLDEYNNSDEKMNNIDDLKQKYSKKNSKLKPNEVIEVKDLKEDEDDDAQETFRETLESVAHKLNRVVYDRVWNRKKYCENISCNSNDKRNTPQS